MIDYKAISWIFLASALASQISPADVAAISMVADGINHAIPTQKELQTSFKWLINNNLLAKTSRKYSLTEKGIEILAVAQAKSNILLQQRAELEVALSNLETYEVLKTS